MSSVAGERQFRRRATTASALIACVVAAGLSGCVPSKPTVSRASGPPESQGPVEFHPPTPPALSNTDPCAMRLHDLCGALLMYYFTNGRLPERLEDLAALPGDTEALNFTCPVSGKPYAYSYEGIRIPEQKTRVIIYDPTPAHLGMRWAVIIEEPERDKALITDVRALPESFFMLRPPTE